jgi:BMFP domain-containing protein YqiC
MDNAFLDELAEKIASGIKMLDGVKQEAQAQIRNALESAFDNLDVVTGERMQVQEALLAKTRERLEELESRIRELEAAPRKVEIKKAAEKKARAKKE